MGTGVSFTSIKNKKIFKHVGGSALGGGTLMGLSKLTLGINSFEELLKLAKKGDSRSLDLLVSDIYGTSYGLTLRSEVVASSMGKIAISDIKPSSEDLASSLVQTICYAIGAQIASVCSSCNLDLCIFVGGFLDIEGIIPESLTAAVNLFNPNVTLIFPKFHRFVGSIGSAIY